MRIIELDCDGVILNIGKAVEESKYGDLMREHNLKWDDLTTYEMREFPKEVRHRIFAAFGDPEVILTEQPYEGAELFLKKLSRKIEGTDVVVQLRSQTPEAAQNAKWQILQKLSYKCGFAGDVKWQIDITADKVALPRYIYVEDCPQNLIDSKAEYRFLMNRCYNAESEYPELKKSNYVRADSYEMLLWLIESAIRKAPERSVIGV